jgi:hypothetical protein
LINKIYNISESGDVEFPIFGDSFSFTKIWKNEFFLNVSRCTSFGGFSYATNKYESYFTICVEFLMISSNKNFFEILKFRQIGGIGVFEKNSIFHKCPKFIILHNNELLNKIYNIYESGDVEFQIFGNRFIFTKFWKNEFFWKMSRVVVVLMVSPMLLTNARVILQYPSSF